MGSYIFTKKKDKWDLLFLPKKDSFLWHFWWHNSDGHKWSQISSSLKVFLFFLSSMENIISGYKIFISSFLFYFNILMMSFHWFLLSFSSHEKSAFILLVISFNVIWHTSTPTAFRFSHFLWFSTVDYDVHRYFFCFIFAELLGSVVNVFHQFWNFSAIICSNISSLSSTSDSNCSHIRRFDIIW